VEAHGDLVFPLTRLGFTAPVLGTQLTDAERGHARCPSLGSGWRWLEFHEQGAWQAFGTWRNGPPVARGWVRIDDQEAECFGGRSSGMTWSGFGEPGALGVTRCEGCDPYHGDTSCSEKRPLYCVASYAGLALAATEPIAGTDIDSVDSADEICRRGFGPGWRWLDFHQQGGWRVSGRWVNGPPSDRGWVWIDNQKAECHSTGGDQGMTWAPTSQPEGASCAGCNPYSGDTPCSEARPLICAKDLWP
jgi:hypothetical protein